MRGEDAPMLSVRRVPCGQVCIRSHARAVRQPRVPCLPSEVADREAWM